MKTRTGSKRFPTATHDPFHPHTLLFFCADISSPDHKSPPNMTIRHHRHPRRHNPEQATAIKKSRCGSCPKPVCKPCTKPTQVLPCGPPCVRDKLVVGFTPEGQGYPICGNRACRVTVVNFNGSPYIEEIQQTFCSPNIFIGPIPPPDPIQ